MSENVIKIFTEDIDFEQWQIILGFSYTDSIETFLERNNIEYNPTTVEHIAGCLIQSHEYFKAASIATLNISPLLCYYGTTNLLQAVLQLSKGSSKKIVKTHGLTLGEPDDCNGIGDLFATVSWEKEGAFRFFSESVAYEAKLQGGDKFDLIDILGAIPELKHDFHSCYPDRTGHIIPVESVRDGKIAFDRIRAEEINRFPEGIDVVKRIDDFSKHYLQANCSGPYWILRHRQFTQEKGIYSITGQKYLQLSQQIDEKRSVTLPALLYYLLGLFILGMVCRYRPELWTPFVRSNKSPERHLIPRFIRTATRIVPNLALNTLLQKRLCFTSIHEGTINLSKSLSDDDVRQIVREEINK